MELSLFSLPRRIHHRIVTWRVEGFPSGWGLGCRASIFSPSRCQHQQLPVCRVRSLRVYVPSEYILGPKATIYGNPLKAQVYLGTWASRASLLSPAGVASPSSKQSGHAKCASCRGFWKFVFAKCERVVTFLRLGSRSGKLPSQFCLPGSHGLSLFGVYAGIKWLGPCVLCSTAVC